MTYNWKVDVGLADNKFVFEAIKLRVEKLKSVDKDCILCCDEMSIKRFLFYNRKMDSIIGFHHSVNSKSDVPANNALILARGINSNWKQPVAYFFVSDSCPVSDLREMLHTIVNNLSYSGLKVRAFITDQGSNFYKLQKDLGVTIETPYFFVDEQQIFYMFDTPHLLKSTRNNLFDNILIYENAEIKKEYLNMLYEFDKTKERKLVPKLTNSHMFPSNFEKMKVKYAAQVLSNSVAVGLECLLSFDYLPPESIHTIKFIEMMDKLFDIFNARSTAAGKMLNRPFCKSPQQLAILQQAQYFFSEVQVVDYKGSNVTKRMRFLYGWQVNINALLQMYDKLNYPALSTRRLNQDCLENFNGKMRQQSGNSKNPTPIQFYRAFKKIFCMNLLDFNLSSDGNNCLPDNDEILIGHEVSTQLGLFVNHEESENVSLLNESDYISLELPEQNVHEYICGYYLKKCLNVHKCDICFNYAHSEQNLNQSRIFINLKNFDKNDTFGKLCVPPEQFSLYIQNLDEQFSDNFPFVAHNNFVGRHLREKLQNVIFNHPCTQFPILFIKFIYKI